MSQISPDRRGADKLFEVWKSNFRDKPKDKENVYNNFNELFFEMSRNFIPSEIAYEFIKPAVTKHIPDSYVVERTYANSPVRKMQSKAEFFEGWKTFILDKATQAFYDVYPLKTVEGQEDSGEKIQLPRGMSKKEYVEQRKHARSFPLLDLSSIEEMYKQVQDEEAVSFDEILGDLDGKATTRQDK